MRKSHGAEYLRSVHHHAVSQVAQKLHVSPGTMTATADRLVKKGYVERYRDEEDRRVIRLGLTHKGRVLFRAHRAFHNMMVKGFLKDMNDEELKVVRKALRNLEDFLDEHA